MNIFCWHLFVSSVKVRSVMDIGDYFSRQECSEGDYGSNNVVNVGMAHEKEL